MSVAEIFSQLDRLGFETAGFLAGALWQSSILFAAAAAISWLLRKRKASLRHALWAAAILAAPLLPLLAWGLSHSGAPRAEVAVLPPYQAFTAVPRLEAPSAREPVAPFAGEFEAPPPMPPQPRRFSPREYPWAFLSIGYAAGVSTLLVWIALGRIQIARWIRRAAPLSDERAVAAFRRAKEALGIRREFPVLESDIVRAPFTVGARRPTVVLPAGFAGSLSDGELAALALHETAHIHRRDPLTLSLVALVRAALFFHPLVWLAARRVSLYAEQAADDAVLASTGEPFFYARTLARIAENIRRPAITAEIAAGIVLTRGAFLSRVEAILSDRRDRFRKLSLAALASLIAASVISLSFALLMPLAEKAAEPRATAPSPSAGKVAVWVTLLPESPVISIRQYDHRFLFRPDLASTLKGLSAELEIRTADNTRQIVSGIPFPGERRADKFFDERQLRRIGEVTDGSYIVAVTSGGVRISNVAPFVIDSTFDAKSEPVLKLVPLPLGPGEELRYLGLVATGPDPSDPKLTNMSASFPTLVVDGVERKLDAIYWNGPVAPLNPGERRLTILDLARYKPAIAAGMRHTVTAKVLSYESAPVTIPADDSLGARWDEATAPKTPPAAPLLRGTVVGPDGRPAAGYEVGISAGQERFREVCDAEGRYEFVNVPPGQYSLHCNPPGQGKPSLSVAEVTLEEGKTLAEDLSFAPKFSLSGTVTYDDGAAGAGLEVVARFASDDGRMEYEAQGTTDADGRYAIPTPFETASYVEVYVSDASRPAPRRNLKAGAGDVDFRLYRTWGEPVEGVQVRLAPEKTLWRAGREVPRFTADIRNTGTRELSVARAQELCELECDGQWYRWQGPVDVKSSSFGPGREYKGIGIWLDAHWRRDGQALTLTPGRHTVRIAFTAEANGGAVRAVSNSVDIELVTADNVADEAARQREQRLQQRITALEEARRQRGARTPQAAAEIDQASRERERRLRERVLARERAAQERTRRQLQTTGPPDEAARQRTLELEKRREERMAAFQRAQVLRETRESAAEPSPVPSVEEPKEFFKLYMELGSFLHNGGSRRQAAQRLSPAPAQDREFFAYIDTDETVSGLAEMLESMAAEDDAFREPDDPEALPEGELVEHHMYKLRDVASAPFDVPGKASFFFGQARGAAEGLRSIGKPAVAVLIDHLEDMRPTRSISSGMNGNHILRYCDASLEILEHIAGRRFDVPRGRGRYLANADDATAGLIRSAVREWWDRYRDAPQAQWLRDALAAGNSYQMATVAAGRLVELEEDRAYEFFRSVLRGEIERPPAQLESYSKLSGKEPGEEGSAGDLDRTMLAGFVWKRYGREAAGDFRALLSSGNLYSRAAAHKYLLMAGDTSMIDGIAREIGKLLEQADQPGRSYSEVHFQLGRFLEALVESGVDEALATAGELCLHDNAGVADDAVRSLYAVSSDGTPRQKAVVLPYMARLLASEDDRRQRAAVWWVLRAYDRIPKDVKTDEEHAEQLKKATVLAAKKMAEIEKQSGQ